MERFDDDRSADGIRKADPGARRAAVIVLACVAVGGVVLLTAVQEWRSQIEEWAAEAPKVRPWLILVGLMSFSSGPLLGFAWYLSRVGRQVMREGEFPPSRMKVITDTPILTGVAALRRGRMLQIIGVTLGGAAVILAVLLWRISSLIHSGCGFHSR